ncbi:unnamed protein product [marine sediment metagenome]|uniref:Uncharacterized protein n=1 Tax=marine sediment metagenome TaxID=412755 RepID=X1BJ55_9ZZZZ
MTIYGDDLNMVVTDTLNKNVLGWVTLGIIIVVGSIVLLQFKGVTGVTAALNTTIDNFVSGIGEPQNWVAIAIIAIIGFAILGIFLKKR